MPRAISCDRTRAAPLRSFCRDAACSAAFSDHVLRPYDKLRLSKWLRPRRSTAFLRASSADDRYHVDQHRDSSRLIRCFRTLDL